VASRNSPCEQGCLLVVQVPSRPTLRLLQHEPSRIRVYPAAQVGTGVGQLARLDGSTAPEQHSPFDVTFAAAQHLPLAVGICPLPHVQLGPGGMWMMIRHWLLFGPAGAWPFGQHIPGDVI
jgi:hypothetical protein